MILALLALLFLLKFNYPEQYLDYLIGVVLLLCLASAALTVYVRIRLHVTIGWKEHTHWEGEPATLRIQVETPEFRTTLRPVLVLKHLQTGNVRTLRTAVEGREGTCLLENLQPGTYALQVRCIWVLSVFRVFRLPYAPGFFKEFYVYPAEKPVNYQRVQQRFLRGEGEIQNAPGDDYTEIYEVRPLEEGDDLRHIHRQLSAKYDAYMVKVGSDSRRPYYVYNMGRPETFADALRDLGAILTLRRKTAKEEGAVAAAVYRGTLYPLATDGELYRLLNEVYRNYLQ